MGQCQAQPLPGSCCRGKDDTIPVISQNEAEAIQKQHAEAMAGGPTSWDHERLSLWCCELTKLAEGPALALSEVPLADALEALAAHSTHVAPSKDPRVGVDFDDGQLRESLRRWVTADAFVNALRPLVPDQPDSPPPKDPASAEAGAGPPADEMTSVLYQIFWILDTDRRGSIALGECSSSAAHLFGGPADEQDKALFKILDADGSGALSKAELGLYLSPLVRVALLPGDLGRQEVLEALTERVFKEVQCNSRGEISFAEWENWVQRCNLTEEVEQAAHAVHREQQASKGSPIP